jgi:endonuclease/exonuclease/phosphatase family metal-dependent hydrolase
MAISMRLATWNVLAPEFCAPAKEGGRDYYAHSRAHLPWHLRMPRILDEVTRLGADVVCLQEVSKVHWERGLKAGLEDLGYEALFAGRPGQRPDGVAILVRQGLRVAAQGAGGFPDDSEKAYLWATLETPRGPVHVASVHLKWDVRAEIPMVQLGHVLDAMGRLEPAPAVVAGDLNVDPLRNRAWPFVAPGWSVAHPDDARPTWIADNRAEKTDAILWRGWSTVRPHPYPDVPPIPGLPSETMPSDHLPLVADLA